MKYRTNPVKIAVSLTYFLCTMLFASSGYAASNANGQPFQNLQDQIDALQAQIDSISGGEVFEGVYNVAVDCTLGDSINSAINTAPATASRVVVEISGDCQESVFFLRDFVSLVGNGAQTSSITGTGGWILNTGGKSGISVSNLTLHAGTSGASLVCNFGWASLGNIVIDRSGQGGVGLNMTSNCNVRGSNIEVQGADTGVVVSDGSVGRFDDLSISGVNGTGLVVINNAVAVLSGGSEIHSNGQGVAVDGNATLQVLDAVVRNNTDFGMVFNTGGYLRTTDGNTLRVLNNGGDGIIFGANTSAAFWLAPTIEIDGNTSLAVYCEPSFAVAGDYPPGPGISINGTIDANCPVLQ